MNKKILFMLGDATSKGGIERVTLTLANKINSLSPHQASILSLYKTKDTVLGDSESLTIDYISNTSEVSMYNRSFGLIRGVFFDINYILKKLSKVRSKIKYNKSDIIVTCDIKMTLLVYLASFFLRKKIIAVEHFEYDVPNTFLKKVRLFLYSKINKIIILTNEDIDKYHWVKEKVTIIPNIVSYKNYDMNKRKVIVAAGRYCYQKGFDLLIESWAKICNKYPDWTLEIYGEGPEKKKLENLIENYNIQNIKLIPFAINIDKVYSSSEIFVLSSRFEGLGMVLIEALAHEMCCISFDCPAGPKTIINNKTNGLLVKTGSIEELSDALAEVINNSDLRYYLKSNALKSVEQFEAETVIKKWEEILK
ncbi:TPA: glycosyltransferase family 4 protein [Photobacterium damselae]